ncbi:2-oxoacid:acceptor oxidoreductase family protein [Helicobacter fennelliae]|uniref:2-oxoglutarate oxidoreductase, gamma subunit n=2 Tax=Helicobacter fennelliae TaxID=215 RepID=T1DVA7_9HELI|nr:2-oxoacid:acceptor oxidoreductase family protein [Helicobacter fennelliae]GAD18382.1 2-oxoglutarate oxidoreductase, gamma subunit [Helicobacter fennelliae MRY12-0050]SQB98299.1 2-oxoglutarate:acceptor oxidoreductase subunit OorC [Helicobacter fennelliae]STP14388.1 2-oxoglutarate:acceptor oxidoreductase subunit OorC [Helicobacter fennelliae]STQ84480.1 2-oxoglutarate:acceptor oxidoreductase subunit OorC [Helicobacter fennelliae]
MEAQLRFTGVGGQGVLLAGEILAESRIRAGGYGIQASTYTSQVRGGPTKVDILLDSKEILYPYAIEGEISFMLSTAQVSYDQFKSGVKDGGIIVVEPNLVKPTPQDEQKFRIYHIPIITIAKEEVGNVVTQSVVALGVTVAFTHCVDRDLVYQTMISKVPAKVVELNKKAFELGEKYANEALKNKS